MAIIPIFIHIHEKSDKEIREEMERERRWQKLMEAEEEERRRRKYEKEMRKILERKEEEKRMEQEYFEASRKNPWDYQFLPEGWDMLGQRYIPVITEYYDE